MIDPLTAATTFATLVGLVGQFLSESEKKEKGDYSEFTDWLAQNRHNELRELLEGNSKATIEVKSLLNQGKEKTAKILLELNSGFINLGKKIDGISYIAEAIESATLREGVGGDGGDGEIIGNRGTIIGGRGGKGGVSGTGGKGGNGYIKGDDGLIIGGDGGNAGTADGRGGKGAKSPMERTDISTEMWPYGRGGSGANAPEYNRRLSVLTKIRQEYITTFPEEKQFIEAGVDQVPINWVNKRLEECNEIWRIELSHGGFVLPPLSNV